MYVYIYIYITPLMKHTWVGKCICCLYLYTCLHVIYLYTLSIFGNGYVLLQLYMLDAPLACIVAGVVRSWRMATGVSEQNNSCG